MHSFRTATILLLLILLKSATELPPVIARQPDVTGDGLVAAISPEGVLVSESGQKVLFFQTKPKSLDGKYTRAAYVHPLWDLDGNVLTEDFPVDHPHHRGIFWAWHQLTVDGRQIGDPWLCSDFLAELLPQSVKVQRQSNGAVRLNVSLAWKSPHWTGPDGVQKPIVVEQTAVIVQPAQGDIRLIDFVIALTAQEKDVRIGGSRDVKGYGGFSTRLRLPDGLKFRLQSGAVEPQKTAVEASPWLDMTAVFGMGTELNGVSVLTHPATPGYPQRWILRQKRSMQNGVFPGRDSVALPRDQTLQFRYRIVLHRGEASGETVDLWQSQFEKK